jgi:general nucleoside transport system permease protein
METLLTPAFMTAFLTGTIAASLPLLLAGLGEQMSEKAGVLNLGLEGMLLAGAFAGFAAALASGSFAVGFAAGILAGMAVGALMAALCVLLPLNQIVIGIGLTLALQGATSLGHHVLYARDFPRLPRQPETAIPVLSSIPVIGPALFTQNLVVYLAFALIPILAWLYRGTVIGLNLKAAGEKPAALDLAGVSVASTRALAVVATGAMAGLGGAYMANIGAGLFVPFMTNGAGFMGVVLAMLARGRPSWVLWGALTVGVATSLTTALQVAGFAIPTDLVQMLPFAMIMLVLTVFGRRAGLPAALGHPYMRGAR